MPIRRQVISAQLELIRLADKHPDVIALLKRLADHAREDLGDSAMKKEGRGVRPPD